MADSNYTESRERRVKRLLNSITHTCPGCGKKEDGTFVPVGEDNLTAFPGELLCVPCGRKHGAC